MFGLYRILYIQCLVYTGFCIFSVWFIQDSVYSVFGLYRILYIQCSVYTGFCIFSVWFIQDSVYSVFGLYRILYIQYLVYTSFTIFVLDFYMDFSVLLEMFCFNRLEDHSPKYICSKNLDIIF